MDVLVPLSDKDDRVSFEDLIKLKDCGTFGHGSYKQWQREDKHKPSDRKRKKKSGVSKQTATTKSPVARGATPVPLDPKYVDDHIPSRRGTPFTPSQKACSSRCRHGPRVPLPRIQKEAKKQMSHAEKQVMKNNILSKKKAIDHYRKLCKELKGKNVALKDTICDMEDAGHSVVNTFLGQYKRCQVLSQSMGTDYEDDRMKVQLAYQNVVLNTTNELDRLQTEVSTLSKTVDSKKKDLNILINYKEEVFPRKIIEIEELKEFIESLRKTCQGELAWLSDIAAVETTNYREDAAISGKCLLLKISQDTVDEVQPVVQLIAAENEKLKKEICILLEKETQLEDEIEVLNQDTRRYKQIDFKRTVFPDVFLEREDCLPDDVVPLRGFPEIKLLPI